jgi:uncharacterized protein YerC
MRVDVYTLWTGYMPSLRHNRAGAREGVLSPELQAALLAESHSLGGVVDAVERIKAVNDFFAQLDIELEHFADTRLEAVSELRAQGWSYDRISKETGLSKARVAQLVKAAGREARPGPT